MVRSIHHINILVRDIDESLKRYCQLLGEKVPIREALPDRGATTARFKVGDTWLVLVQPVGDGVPARTLAARGEGIFLLSFAVTDLLGATQRLDEGRIGVDGASRQGLANWRVIDLDPAIQTGLTLQLCEESSAADEPPSAPPTSQ